MLLVEAMTFIDIFCQLYKLIVSYIKFFESVANFRTAWFKCILIQKLQLEEF